MAIIRVRSPFRSKGFEYEVDVTFQLQSFHTYVKTTRSLIEVEIKSKIREYERIMREEYDDYTELGFHFDEMDILQHTCYLYYSSIFISICSFLERKMRQVCEIAQGNTGIKITAGSDTGIRKYYKYIQNSIGVDLVAIDNEWNIACDYAAFRNQLVHENSVQENDVRLTHDGLTDYLSVVARLLDHIVHECV